MTDAEFRKFYSLHLNRISALRKNRVSLDAAITRSRGAARTERLADAVNCDADMGNETLEILAAAVPLHKKKAVKSCAKLLKNQINVYKTDVKRLNRADDVYHELPEKDLFDKALSGVPGLSFARVEPHTTSRAVALAPLGIAAENGAGTVATDRFDEIVALRHERNLLMAKRDGTEGKARAEATIPVLNIQRNICLILFELLAKARDVGDDRQTSYCRQIALSEIRYYNSLLAELDALCGTEHLIIEENAVNDILAGKPAPLIPALMAAGDAAAPAATMQAFMKDSYTRIDGLRRERQQLERERKNKDGTDVVRLYIRILNLQKNICDILFALLTRATAEKNRRLKNRFASEAAREIDVYNGFVRQLNRVSGEKYDNADRSAPAKILAGKSYREIPLLAFYGDNTVSEYNSAIAEYERSLDGSLADDVIQTTTAATEEQKIREARLLRQMDRRDFEKYVAKLLGILNVLKRTRNSQCAGKKKSRGNHRIRLQADLLNTQKQICDTYFEILTGATYLHYARYGKKFRGDAKAEIRRYNRELREMEKLDGKRHTEADLSIPDKILAGKPYTPIAAFTCRMPALNGFTSGKRSAQEMRTDRRQTDAAMLEARFNHALLHADQELVLRKSSFTADSRRGRAMRSDWRVYRRQLARLRKRAARCEAADNARYEKILSANPATVKVPRRRADRDRLAELRGKIDQLLARRDELNVELIALYAGTNEKSSSKVDLKFNKRFAKEKHRAYRRQMPVAGKINRFYIPIPDKEKLLALLDRKSYLIAVIRTEKYKIRLYRLRGNGKRCVRSEAASARRELRRLDKEIRYRVKRAEMKDATMPRPAAQLTCLVILILLAVGGYCLYRYGVFAAIGEWFRNLLNGTGA